MKKFMIITYFITAIKKTGKYQRMYKDWVVRDNTNRTWAHAKDFWQIEHLKLHRLSPTAFQYQFGRNAAQNQSEKKNDMANILEDCANQLMTGQQEARTLQKPFQEMMAAQINAMQQQLAMQQESTAAAMQQNAAAMAAN